MTTNANTPANIIINAENIFDAVAVTNGDAYCVEGDIAEETAALWAEARDKQVLTEADGEAYEVWAARLDFDGEVKPRAIHVGYLDGYQMAIVLAGDNPYRD